MEGPHRHKRRSDKETDPDFDGDNYYTSLSDNAYSNQFASNPTPTRAQLAGYRTYAYDNPNFLDPPIQPTYDHYAKMAFAQSSESYSLSEEQRSRDDRKRWTRKSSYKCKVITAVVVLIVFVVTAISLAVYFSAQAMSDNNRALGSDEATTTPASVEQEPVFVAEIRVTSEEFTPELADPTSQVYKDKKAQVEDELDKTFMSSSYADIYNFSEVISFSNGSVKVKFIPHFKDEKKATPQQKQALKEIKENPSAVKSAYVQSYLERKKNNQTTLAVDTTSTSFSVVTTTTSTTTTTLASTTVTQQQTTVTTTQPTTTEATTTQQPTTIIQQTTTTAQQPTTTAQQQITTTTQQPATTTAQQLTTTAEQATTTVQQPETTTAQQLTTTAEQATTTVQQPETTTAQQPTTTSAQQPTTTTAQQATTTVQQPETTTAQQPTTTAAQQPTTTTAQQATTTVQQPETTKEQQPTTTTAQQPATTTAQQATTTAQQPETTTAQQPATTTAQQPTTTTAQQATTTVQQPETTTAQQPTTTTAQQPTTTTAQRATTTVQQPETTTAQQPTTTTAQQPTTTTAQQVTTTVQQPETTTAQQPTTTAAQQPTTTTAQQATTTVQQPETPTAQQPTTTAAQQPTTTTAQQATTTVQQPTTTTAQQPTTTTAQQPTTTTTQQSATTATTRQPTTTAQQSATTTAQQPITTAQQPETTAHQPTTTTAQQPSTLTTSQQQTTTSGKTTLSRTTEQTTTVSAQEDTKCPDWSEVRKVMSDLCSSSMVALKSAATPADACLHYSNTIKCGVFILRTRNKKCQLMELFEMARNSTDLFPKQAAGIDVTSKCSGDKLQFSVDIDQTPLCLVPDALMYITHYESSNSDNNSRDLLPFRRNPCSVVLQKAARVNKELESLGLRCNIFNLTTVLTEQNYSAMPEFQREIDRCSAYGKKQETDKCFNLSDSSVQKECGTYFLSMYGERILPKDQACRVAEDFFSCTMKVTGCSLEETRESALNLWSVILTYQQLFNVSIAGDINRANVFNFLTCYYDTKCPDWSEVREVMSDVCNSSMMALKTAATPADACLHYSNTIKCGVFILRTRNKKCQLMELFEMARNSTDLFPKQAAGIDVTSKCPGDKIQFSVDIDRTPLCLVPDALMYITHYESSNSDNNSHDLLPFRRNPCSVVLQKAARVNKELESLGLRCNIFSLNAVLLELNYTAMPEFQKEVASCSAYTEKSATDKCFNISDSSVQKECWRYLSTMYDIRNLPKDEACRAAHGLVRCTSKVIECGLEKTQKSALDFWSVILTYHQLYNISIANNSNKFNVLNFLACDHDTKCPDWSEVWELMSDSCNSSMMALKSAATPADACLHYSNTIKCGVFILRTRNKKCELMELVQMVRNSTGLFPKQAAGIDVTSKCSGDKLQFSVDIDKTPLCLIPDALMYITLYNSDDNPRDLFHRDLRPNPCSVVLQKAARVNKDLESLGLMCNIFNLTTVLTEQNYSAMPEFQLEVDRCSAYGKKQETDQCFNLSDSSVQKECGTYFLSMYGERILPKDQACRVAEDFFSCTMKVTGCGLEETRESALNLWSVILTYQQLFNVSIAGDVNRANIFNFLTCYYERPGECQPSDGFGITVHECDNDIDCMHPKKCCQVGGGAGQVCQDPIFNFENCSDWGTVWKLASVHCMRSLMNTRQCSGYADFIRCAAFVMRTQHYNCSEDIIKRMALANDRYFYTKSSSDWSRYQTTSDYSDYHGSSRLHGSSDSMTSDHSHSDHDRWTSDTLYPSYSDSMSSDQSFTNYQSSPSSPHHSSWDGDMGSSSEISLPVRCRDYRLPPSKVDLIKTKPCANQDAYEYILKYHCSDDMDSDSWQPAPSGTWRPTPSDTWRPAPSDTWRPDPSDTRRPTPGDTWRPTPSDTWRPNPSDTWRPTPSDSWRPTPSDTWRPNPSDSWRTTPSDSWHSSSGNPWRPTPTAPPSNSLWSPCFRMMRRYQCIKKKLQDIGLVCPVETIIETSQNYNTSVPAAEVKSCNEYGHKVMTDRCINLTSTDPCAQYFDFLSHNSWVDDICGSFQKGMQCISKVRKGCPLEQVNSAWRKYLRYILNMGAADPFKTYNHAAIEKVLACSDTKCPDWSEVREVMSDVCSSSMMALKMAATPADACLHYSNTIKCGVFILRTRNKKCELMELVEMACNSTDLFPKQAAGIDVTSKCSGDKIQFSVDIDKTPLCLVPDALMYITHYESNHSDDNSRDLLPFRRNPCSVVLQKAARVNKELESLGLRCNIFNLTTVLTEQIYSTMPEFQQEIDRCSAYGKKQETDKCFNLSDSSVQKECGIYLFSMYGEHILPKDQACRVAQDFFSCTMKVTGCSLEETRESALNLWSVILTYQQLFNVSIAGNVNRANVFNFLTCHYERPGECRPSDGFGITVHECDNDIDCMHPKKCCQVGGGAGQVCQDPIFKRPGECRPSDGFGITVHECDNDIDCMHPKKCCQVGGGAGQICQDPIFNFENCSDWGTVWRLASVHCRRSLMNARQCSGYADFIRCAAFVMRTQHYNCSEDIIKRMALANDRYFYTESSSDWSRYQTTSDYSDYHGSSRLHGSSDSMTSDHSHSDHDRWASDTLYPSYSDSMSSDQSFTNYQSSPSSHRHSSWEGDMSSSSETSLPVRCRDYRLPPSKVDLIKTKPCANQDAYEYILKYHCSDDMDSDSWRPTPSDTWRPTPSDTWRPNPSHTWRPTPSGTLRPTPSGTSRPTPSDSRRPNPSHTWRPTPSDSWRPTPSDSWRPNPSDTWRPTPSDSWRPNPSETWRPTPSDTLRPTPSDSWRPNPSDTWQPTPSDSWRTTPSDSWHSSSGNPWRPTPTAPPSDSLWSPCFRMMRQYQCIKKKLLDIGLVCPVETIIETSQNYNTSVPAAEVKSCNEYGHKVMTDRCINLTSTDHCAQYFDFLSYNSWVDDICGSFQKGMQCISEVRKGCFFEQVNSAWRKYLRYILTMGAADPFKTFNHATIEKVLACSERPGKCPPPDAVKADKRCEQDADCGYQQKCCTARHGRMCHDPNFKNMSSCPDWRSLWDITGDRCMASIQSTRAATDLQSACYHYVSSLKCASYMSRILQFDCQLRDLTLMAARDTEVFTNQKKGFRVAEQCRDTKMDWISKPDDTPICESVDAYQYIVKYICSDGRVDSSTYSPFPDKTRPWGYDTSTPTGPFYQKSSSYNYPGLTVTTPPSKWYDKTTWRYDTTTPTGPFYQRSSSYYYPKLTTVTTPTTSPFSKWYDKTTGRSWTEKHYSHYDTTTWPYWRASTTDMPDRMHCQEYIQWGECIHRTLNELLFCPKDKVFKVLGKYNQTILPEPAKQCQESKRSGCPSYEVLTKLVDKRCERIMSDHSVRSHIAMSSNHSATTMPSAHNSQCRQYRDIMNCLALAVTEQYDCDTKDIHEVAKRNSNMFFRKYGFFPSECDDNVPDKMPGSDGVCQNPALYALLDKYHCYYSLPANFSKINSSTCLHFYGSLSCLSTEAATILGDRKCSEADVASFIKASWSSPLFRLKGCLNATLLVGEQGHVLVRQENHWSTVCGHNWDNNDAKVVCRQLGFENGYAFKRNGEAYVDAIKVSPGLTSVTCDGSESVFSECRYNLAVTCDKSDNKVAAVTCFNGDLSYKLVPAKQNASYGFINMTRGNSSGLVCAHETQHNDAASLCYAAGFKFGGMVYSPYLAPPKHGDAWTNYIYCKDEDQDIEACVSSKWQFVSYSDYNGSSWSGLGQSVSHSSYNDSSRNSSVQHVSHSSHQHSRGNSSESYCGNMGSSLVKVLCFEKPVVLHTGSLASSGVPQMFMSEDMSTRLKPFPFCRENFSNFTADLFCREIGFPQGGIALGFDPYAYQVKRYYYQVNCSGQETSFLDCDIRKMFTPCDKPAIVRCNHDRDDGVSDLDVSLRKTRYQEPTQVVFTYLQGEWGTICADSWSDAEASVVCKSQGYDGGFATNAYKQNDWQYLIYNVSCQKNNSNLRQCQFSSLQSDNICDRTDIVAAVRCYREGDLAQYTLEGGSSNDYGYVMITVNKTKGLLCSYLEDDAFGILCRSLGFSGGERYSGDLRHSQTTAAWQTYYSSCFPHLTSLEACRGEHFQPFRNYRHDMTWNSNNYTQLNTTNRTLPECWNGYAKAYCYGRMKLHTGFKNTSGILQGILDDTYEDLCAEKVTQKALDILCQKTTGLLHALRLPPPVFPDHKRYSYGHLYVNSSCVEARQPIERCLRAGDRCSSNLAVLCYEGAAKPNDTLGTWKLDGAGTVMVKRYGIWGLVCTDGFPDIAASLLCKAQGMSYDKTYADYGAFKGRVPFWVENVSCPSSATSFSDCHFTMISNYSKDHCSSARVRCYIPYLSNSFGVNITLTVSAVFGGETEMPAQQIEKELNRYLQGIPGLIEMKIIYSKRSMPGSMNIFLSVDVRNGTGVNTMKTMMTALYQVPLHWYGQQYSIENVAEWKNGLCANRKSCANYGMCVSNRTASMCVCPQGFYGEYCEKGKMVLFSCPAWKILWASILKDMCMPSIASTRAADNLQSACYHYVSSLKCASYMSKIRQFDCQLKDLAAKAAKDTEVFANQKMGYNVSEQCRGTEMDWSSKPDDNPSSFCGSYDVYQYIVKYICSDGRHDRPTHSPYPDKTHSWQYDTTMPTGPFYQRSSSYKYPGLSATTTPRSKDSYTGWATTSTPGSKDSYTGWKTTNTPGSKDSYTGWKTTNTPGSKDSYTGWKTTNTPGSKDSYTGWKTTNTPGSKDSYTGWKTTNTPGSKDSYTGWKTTNTPGSKDSYTGWKTTNTPGSKDSYTGWKTTNTPGSKDSYTGWKTTNTPGSKDSYTGWKTTNTPGSKDSYTGWKTTNTPGSKDSYTGWKTTNTPGSKDSYTGWKTTNTPGSKDSYTGWKTTYTPGSKGTYTTTPSNWYDKTTWSSWTGKYHSHYDTTTWPYWRTPTTDMPGHTNMPCSDYIQWGKCIHRTLNDVLFCPRDKVFEVLGKYKQTILPDPAKQCQDGILPELKPCNWNSMWQQVSGPCMASLIAARYPQRDQCRHYDAFLKCASMIMQSRHYRCPIQQIDQMAQENYWHFQTGGSSRGSEHYDSSTSYPYTGSFSDNFDSSASSSGSYSAQTNSEFHGPSSSDHHMSPSNLHGSSDFMTNDHSHSDHDSWASDTLYPSFSDSMSSDQSFTNYQSSPSSHRHSSWDGDMGSSSELSLPVKCRGHRKPVDKSELCSNPDAYEYILKYHCADDMGPNHHTGQPSHTDSWYPSSSGSWYPSSSGSWHSSSSYSRHSSSSEHSPSSDEWQPSSSGRWYSTSSDAWQPTPTQPDKPFSDQYPNPSRPPALSDMPCKRLASKAECVQQKLHDIGATCHADTDSILSTFNRYSWLLPKETYQCHEFLAKLKQDDCFFALVNGRRCLQVFHKVGYDDTCRSLNAAIKCSVVNYPLQCGQEKAAKILLHWLSLEHIFKLKDIVVNAYTKQNVLHCSYNLSGQGCPPFEELLNKTSQRFGSGSDDARLFANITSGNFCRLFEEFWAVGMQYPHCNMQEFREMIMNNQDAIRNLTGLNSMDMEKCAAKRQDTDNNEMVMSVPVPKLFFVDYDQLDAVNSQGIVTRGRVAVEYRGVPAYICSNGTTPTEQAANEMCREMGFPLGGEVLRAELPAPQKFPMGWTMTTTCVQENSTEHAIQSCVAERQLESIRYNHTNGTDHSNLTACGKTVAAISCFDDNYRLALAINNSSHGLLLVWNKETHEWNPVCRDKFEALEANVTCRQLGLSKTGDVTWPGNLPPHSFEYTLRNTTFMCNSVSGQKLDNCSVVPKDHCMELQPVWLACLDHDVN